MKEEPLVVYNVSFYIDGREILKKINFALPKGEVLQILGERGSGKTTLFKICLGLLKPSFGEVFLFDKEISKANYNILKEIRKKIGVVFQEPAPVNNITIFENVALPLRYHYNLKEKEIRKKVEEVLEKFKIKNFSELRPANVDIQTNIKLELSRALVVNPEIFFFDEIFSRLKLEEKLDILGILSKEKERGKTFFIISNEKILFKNFSTYAILLEGGRITLQGKISEIGEKIFEKNIFE